MRWLVRQVWRSTTSAPGYSSLIHLERIPVEELRVDRTFVVGLLAGAEDAAIVSAVVDLADTPGKAVAEGVGSAGRGRAA